MSARAIFVPLVRDIIDDLADGLVQIIGPGLDRLDLIGVDEIVGLGEDCRVGQSHLYQEDCRHASEIPLRQQRRMHREMILAQECVGFRRS